MKKGLILSILILGILSGSAQEMRKKYTLPYHFVNNGYYSTVIEFSVRDTIPVKIFLKNGQSEEGFKEVWIWQGDAYDAKNKIDAWKRGWRFYHKDGTRVKEKVKYYSL